MSGRLPRRGGDQGDHGAAVVEGQAEECAIAYLDPPSKNDLRGASPLSEPAFSARLSLRGAARRGPASW